MNFSNDGSINRSNLLSSVLNELLNKLAHGVNIRFAVMDQLQFQQNSVAIKTQKGALLHTKVRFLSFEIQKTILIHK